MTCVREERGRREEGGGGGGRLAYMAHCGGGGSSCIMCTTVRMDGVVRKRGWGGGTNLGGQPKIIVSYIRPRTWRPGSFH